ncbi:AraC family transcriptional regulator [Cohnella sp. NL03-T5]|nr:AraC family transcriptional regulator [Cohnella silvisoli]
MCRRWLRGPRCRLNISNSLTIEQIADRVGKGDLFYFSKLFKKMEGMPPKKYADSLKWLSTKGL